MDTAPARSLASVTNHTILFAERMGTPTTTTAWQNVLELTSHAMESVLARSTVSKR